MIRRFYPSNKTLMRMGAAVCLAAMAVLAIGGHGTAEPAAAIVNENGPMIALTFDDGPYPKVTGHILDVLEKNGVCATFFVLGSRIEGHEDNTHHFREAYDLISLYEPIRGSATTVWITDDGEVDNAFHIGVRFLDGDSWPHALAKEVIFEEGASHPPWFFMAEFSFLFFVEFIANSLVLR